MDIELQKKLFEKYPKIFRQKDLSMQQTCMCWGIECGNGWYWLLDKLCDYIQSMIDNNPSTWPQIEATQVKEKYGGLCFYYDGGNSCVDGAIMLAENLSYNICEFCGSTVDVSQSNKGWIVTLCKPCHLERNKKRKPRKSRFILFLRKLLNLV